jgi:DNA-directed RNA polymerase beta' subunit
LRFQASLKSKYQSWQEIIAYFISWDFDFDLFQEREIATGGKAIRDQLAGLDLQIILDRSYVEWKRLDEIISIFFTGTEDVEQYVEEEEGLMYDKFKEQELQKLRRRKDLLVRRMRLAQYFVQAHIEPQWMVLCLLPVLPPDLRQCFN